jgi:hypothetical protein
MSNSFEAEKELLAAVAKSQGITVEQLLEQQGKTVAKPTSEDSTVVFSEVPSPIAETATLAPADPTVTFVPNLPDLAPPPPAAVEESVSETSAASVAPICTHCGWDQRRPPLDPPDKQDKLVFLATVLGQKVFTKDYSTLGGKLKMSFRGLTVQELDALYTSAYREQRAGRIESTQEYYDYLNRQRLFLQLQTLNASASAMHFVLPDGLSKKTNKLCGIDWEDFLKDKAEYDAEDELIPQIEAYVLKEVLCTEHLQRIVSHYCAKFNQLVAKLEVCIDDENFWKETATPL